MLGVGDYQIAQPPESNSYYFFTLIVKDLNNLTWTIQDHAAIYLDYRLTGPILDIGDASVTRKMDQLLDKFILTDGTTFKSILKNPRAALTAQDWGDVQDFLTDPVLGTFEFGNYLTLEAGCKIESVTIRANGVDLQWLAAKG